MATEHFILTALPHSMDAAAQFHVSLFVSPRLEAAAPEARLGDFRVFPQWARNLIDGAEIQLTDQDGPIACRPCFALDPDIVDPEVWQAVFPLDIPVRGHPAPAWSGRHWRTFRAGAIHDAGKLLHIATILASPTKLPAPSQHPLGEIARALRGRTARAKAGNRGYDESVFTKHLDRTLGEPQVPRGGKLLLAPQRSLEQIEMIVDREQDGDEGSAFFRLAMHLHRARRYYERAEGLLRQAEERRVAEGRTSQGLPPLRSPPLARPILDFHDRCGLVGDHPALLRKLGLVIDLVVDEPERLRMSTWLSSRIVSRVDRDACRSTRTACQPAGQGAVTVVPHSSDWSLGRLRVGDPELFALLDLEVDGTALKLDRFLWTLPRLLTAEEDREPAHAAPPALRAVGFTLARNRRALATQSRMARQSDLLKRIEAGEQPLLFAEDVTTAMRVEVWDDTAGRWYSLHARRSDVEVVGVGTVLADHAEQGFIQGTAAHETLGVEGSPIHVHEAVFAWDGWSLSAPRPGKRIRHDDGREIVEDVSTTDPDPMTPVQITLRVQAGSLPRLRYGRAYAFRAWAVDLAGNSRPHTLVSAGDPAIPREHQLATVPGIAHGMPAHFLERELREQLQSLVRRASARAVEPKTSVSSPPLALLAGEVGEQMAARLQARRSAAGPSAVATSVNRAALVGQAFAAAIDDGNGPLVADTSVTDPRRLHAMLVPTRPAGRAAFELRDVSETITALRPFLRWHPVPPPALVPRHRYTAGESLRRVVVRSGVTQDRDTLKITITSPRDYAAAHGKLGYHATSERHVAPPKCSQLDAELHGRFDGAIGAHDPELHRRQARVAARESGSFFDVDVPDLRDLGLRAPQLGIALEHDDGANPADLLALPLPPDTTPPAGQYVIHDSDQLMLPYLPDSAAHGLSIVFPEAGVGRRIPFPFGTEGFNADYTGAWPALEPYRLVLGASPVLTATVEHNVVRFELPPGDVQLLRLSSTIARPDLELFGPWRSLPGAVRGDAVVAEAAADGLTWALTPSEDITLVHAVPRPLEAPRPTRLEPIRSAGDTSCRFLGGVDVHGASTESMTAEGVWTEQGDDVTLPAPEIRIRRAVAFMTPILPFEDVAVLAGVEEDVDFYLPGVGTLRAHANVHQLGDTRHRVIRYRFRATTRFREYFDPSELTPPAATNEAGGAGTDRPEDDGRSVIGPAIEVSIPSTARPAAPVVHSVLPLFRWTESTEPEQPVAVRRRRQCGVRIYLDRPWYSSGDGELLSVLLAPGHDDRNIQPWVSQWGGDPVWAAAPVAWRALGDQVRDLLAFARNGPSDANDAMPVLQRRLPLLDVSGRPLVDALGYRPVFSEDRQLWYVDVAIDPGSAFWPFVRLAVARLQPDSIADCHLSPVVRCDFVQLTPERTATVSRTDSRHVRIVVTGPIGARSRVDSSGPFSAGTQKLAQAVNHNRSIIARLQRRDPAIPTDLGWETVTVTGLALRGYGSNGFEAAWVGSLQTPENLTITRPGANQDWRVVVEEWEHLPGDPTSLAPGTMTEPVWERRLVYADELNL
jgi:hypothetical protein